MDATTSPAPWNGTVRSIPAEPESFDGPRLAATLARADIMRTVHSDYLADLAALGNVVELPADTIIGVRGGRCEHLYVIIEGAVELSAPTPAGYRRLRVAGPCETVPLSALIGDGTLITTALAMGNVLAFEIPVGSVLALCERYTEMGAAVFREIAVILGGRYRKTVDRLTELDGTQSDDTLAAVSGLFPS
jgi:CRP-like cAMP-binding protein